MTARFNLGDISIDVVFKDIKNVHLSVHPPNGRVRISAPERMKLDNIRVFALSKLDWIKRQQSQLRAQQRETPREYLERESHFVWGARHLLQITEVDSTPGVEITHGKIILKLRPESSRDQKQEIIERFYRDQIKMVAAPVLAKWTSLLGVSVEKFYVREMKTKWGSCNPYARAIRLNTELAKKPRRCLEYIVVHELAHLIERRHNDRFLSIMDQYLPQWRPLRQELNSAPLSCPKWLC